MANEAPKQSSTDITTQTFVEGMVKDMSSIFTKKGSWTHAINAVNNSHRGELAALMSEPANLKCCNAPYTIINCTHIQSDKWVIFSTDNIDSEIGIFDESECSYSTKVNQKDLAFKTFNSISAVTKLNPDCSFSVYWTDKGNPDRRINFNNIPYVRIPNSTNPDNCNYKLSTKVNIEELRLSALTSVPKYSLKKGTGAGNLLNGTYQAIIAYSVKGTRLTDYFIPSNSQSLWSHKNSNGSLNVIIENMDNSFDEFELVIVSNINLQTTAKRVGYYSTSQKSISIDYLPTTLPNIPLDNIVVTTPAYYQSDKLSTVNNYLLRIGVKTQPEFNYQPQANKIIPKWAAIELPADYYYKGGNLTSYMRDEQQPFFIRWRDTSGKVSANYPIIGRKATSDELSNVSGGDAFESKDSKFVKKWQSENTATITSREKIILDEGKVIAQGNMGYWESTELYPSQIDIWGELCGKPIRHPKFPDNALVPHFNNNGDNIVILGVTFEGITHPLDLKGDPIPNIVGYEILKGSLEGNKTVIAKGMINNVGKYDIPKGITDKQGIYPNYPFNDVRVDPFLSKGVVRGGCKDKGEGYIEMGEFSKNVFTFHSPDTQFKDPFLSTNELKIYGEISGEVIGEFQPVFKHPRHKLIRDFALIVSGLIGIGEGLLAIKGKTTTSEEGSKKVSTNLTTTGLNAGLTFNTPGSGAASTAIQLLKENAYKLAQVAYSSNIIPVLDVPLKAVRDKAWAAYQLAVVGNTIGGSTTITEEKTPYSSLPLPLRALGGTIMFSYYFSQGTEATLRIIKNIVPFQQYAYQYNSHGFYNQFKPATKGNKRKKINEIEYLEPHLQEFTSRYRINNLFRSRQVILETAGDILPNTVKDTTRQTIGQLKKWTDPTGKVASQTSAYYAAIKVPMDNQFGQIDSIQSIPISDTYSTEPSKLKIFNSPILFGGDIYINRFTEKNSFFYFNNWMYDLKDGTELNYNNHYNIPNPRYWMNSEEYDISNLTSSLIKLNFNTNALPNDMAHLDRKDSDCNSKISFVINNAYFYLFNSGIRDFFVESEINLAQRDYEDLISQRHYDYKSYTDVNALFRSDVITAGNHYKYDYSLSKSKLLTNNVSWGSVLPKDFNPYNQDCYSYMPNKVIYSLQQQDDLKKDNWLAFLANNAKNFHSSITDIREINGTGALILFQEESPRMFQGVDSLSLDSGIKITIGDGGLFAQPEQAVSASNKSYEFGSCQNKYSIENTERGVYWVSANQGKIFSYAQGLDDITLGMKYWFAQYLPFNLLKDFPDFEMMDNPIEGISLSTIYDNTSSILYFCKKDWKLKSEYKSRTEYKGLGMFLVDKQKVRLGDPLYFEDASFTVSYDTKDKKWISFHDWHPNFTLPSKTHFMTVLGDSVWKHNIRCDLFCNFYGQDYPFVIEYLDSTGQDVNTLRSIEYQMEAYRYFNECRDAFHILDQNFDRLIVSNTEQNSGLIKLVIKPKNSPTSIILGKIQGIEDTTLFCSKEENKYRVNGITDLTRDRGEFTEISRPMWITKANGYQKDINPMNINYNKKLLQRKKMRHYSTTIRLQKNICGDSQLILHLTNNKFQKSLK